MKVRYHFLMTRDFCLNYAGDVFALSLMSELHLICFNFLPECSDIFDCNRNNFCRSSQQNAKKVAKKAIYTQQLTKHAKLNGHCIHRYPCTRGSRYHRRQHVRNFCLLDSEIPSKTNLFSSDQPRSR